MQLFGFNKDKEYLPQYSYCNTTYKKRKLFLHFLNLHLDNTMFEKSDFCRCKDQTLFTIYKNKITQLLRSPSSNKVQKVVFNCKVNEFIQYHGIIASPLLRSKFFSYKKVVQLVSLIDNDYENILLNSDELFKNFVHKSITSLKRDRVVTKEKDCIDMYLKHDANIKVIPYWERGEKVNDMHIQKAVDCIKKSDFKNIYLVYPKEDDFKKHIDIKVPELEGCSEYVIKIIPYSLKTIL